MCTVEELMNVRVNGVIILSLISLDLENPNHDQQLLTVDIKGAPCPGGFGIPIGHRTYRCMYKNNSEIQMHFIRPSKINRVILDIIYMARL
jgi:hypothetical protein